jgi:hypothetical protein
MDFHEALESLSVTLGLNGRQSSTVLEQNFCFEESLYFFVQIPILQVVYDRDVVNSITVSKTMLGF